MKKLLASLLVATASFSATATTAPTATGLTKYNGTTSVGFEQYTGTIVGSNDLATTFNENRTVFWLGEGVHNGKQSYLIMFDPSGSSNVKGSISFAGAISAIYDTKAELLSSSSFQKASVTYDWKNGSGLESTEASNTSFSGNTLNIHWSASSPGDYVRVVLAPVPEPETYAMFLAGLGILGAVARRRKAG